ncbi:MAG TPA: Glu/Leu/Phe/Val dehydrogenase dimerization domain-containing protein [Solirubrobacteraceae bacterium]|jgi:leucine dehydrogenase|nr:Glu/Leu/Phe/Val dehydrogenase dimerization domain-containing protein [Solirubrobacteraceae bacterium]
MEESSWDRWHSEQLVLCQDDSVGLRAVIAIDDTTLGPGLGGVRCVGYPSDEAAIIEAQRLAASMTLKNAFAGLPYGGGKSVILAPAREVDRLALMRSFGEFVIRAGGAYVPGVDMGTTVDDLQAMADAGADVSCNDEDPSPWTAVGVAAAARAAVEHVDHRKGIEGTRVLIQGAGHVGAALARDLAADGAEIVLSDIDAERAVAVAAEIGGSTVPADDALDTRCDLFAPCSIAKVVTPATARRLECRMIVGAANDTLSDPGCAELLAAREITYVPDFVSNAGGVIHIHSLRAGHTEKRLREDVLRIGARTREILETASSARETPLKIATERVRRILADAGGAADGARSSGAARRGNSNDRALLHA